MSRTQRMCQSILPTTTKSQQQQQQQQKQQQQQQQRQKQQNNKTRVRGTRTLLPCGLFAQFSGSGGKERLGN